MVQKVIVPFLLCASGPCNLVLRVPLLPLTWSEREEGKKGDPWNEAGIPCKNP